jgi:hypothetical protein
MLSTDLKAVGPKNASRIWGFMSKFVMLDRFIKALGAAEIHPGLCVARRTCPMEYFGTVDRVSIFLLKISLLISLLIGLSDPR